MASVNDSMDSMLSEFAGWMTIQDLISLSLECILWGFYFILFSAAIVIQWRRGFETLGLRLILAVTLALFASSTVLLASKLAGGILLLKYIVLENSKLGWGGGLAAVASALEPLSIPMEALFLFNILMGDAVVVIRAKVIWETSGSRRFVFVPLVFLIAAFAFAVTTITCMSLTPNDLNASSQLASGPWVCRRAEPIAWTFSLLTNLTSTLLIARVAWVHRKEILVLRGPDRRKTTTEHILNLLVESGLAYFLFLLTQVVLFIDTGTSVTGLPQVSSSAQWAYVILNPLGDQMSGIYSTSVIILVVLQRTSWEVTAQNNDGSASNEGEKDRTLTQIAFDEEIVSKGSTT
ncbi:hypothetical protein DL96DRAFT_266409 [Flagelloscypha sp. PMI_526]|nr:hypothetical protein DL96DRAFT_266409 [Flagelloscypha sp. PMI_526]